MCSLTENKTEKEQQLEGPHGGLVKTILFCGKEAVNKNFEDFYRGFSGLYSPPAHVKFSSWTRLVGAIHYRRRVNISERASNEALVYSHCGIPSGLL